MGTGVSVLVLGAAAGLCCYKGKSKKKKGGNLGTKENSGGVDDPIQRKNFETVGIGVIDDIFEKCEALLTPIYDTSEAIEFAFVSLQNCVDDSNNVPKSQVLNVALQKLKQSGVEIQLVVEGSHFTVLPNPSDPGTSAGIVQALNSIVGAGGTLIDSIPGVIEQVAGLASEASEFPDQIKDLASSAGNQPTNHSFFVLFTTLKGEWHKSTKNNNRESTYCECRIKHV